MPDYQIVRVIEEPTLVDGKPGAVLRVEFKVGDHGPFFERFPKADVSDFAISQRLGAFAALLKRAGA